VSRKPESKLKGEFRIQIIFEIASLDMILSATRYNDWYCAHEGAVRTQIHDCDGDGMNDVTCVDEATGHSGYLPTSHGAACMQAKADIFWSPGPLWKKCPPAAPANAQECYQVSAIIGIERC
jgi:hypothetical protein